MNGRTKRRQYFSRRRVQFPFILIFCLLVFVQGIATGVATYIVADEVLSKAMFRAHFTERSTGDVLLSVIVRVNAVAALCVMVVGLLTALYWFTRQSRKLNKLVQRMSEWQRDLRHKDAKRADPSPTLSQATPKSDLGWISEMEESYHYANRKLRTTYASVATAASELLTSAATLETNLANSAATTADQAVVSLNDFAQRLETIKSELARYQSSEYNISHYPVS